MEPEPEEPIAFPQVGDYGPYYKWKEDGEYKVNDIVFHEGYLYRLMGNLEDEDPLDPYISINEDPRTATFSCKFYDDSGVNAFYERDDEVTLTMRRWMLFDLPAGYYHAMLRGFDKNGLISSQISPFCQHMYMICVRAFAKIKVIEMPDPPSDELSTSGHIDARTPVTDCSYAGYRLNSGLDATYSDDELVGGGLIYSFTAIPISNADSNNSAYQREEFESERSLVWMPNTIVTYDAYPGSGIGYGGHSDESNGVSYETQQSLHSSMQVFSRSFSGRGYDDDGLPVSASWTTVSFEDEWATGTPDDGGIPWSTSPDYATE